MVHENNWIWGKAWTIILEGGKGMVQVSKANDEEEAIIHNLSVIPEERRKGLGKRLMEEAETLITQQGFQTIRLDVESGNENLIRWYEKLGYTNVGCLDLEDSYNTMMKNVDG